MRNDGQGFRWLPKTKIWHERFVPPKAPKDLGAGRVAHHARAFGDTRAFHHLFVSSTARGVVVLVRLSRFLS